MLVKPFLLICKQVPNAYIEPLSFYVFDRECKINRYAIISSVFFTPLFINQTAKLCHIPLSLIRCKLLTLFINLTFLNFSAYDTSNDRYNQQRGGRPTSMLSTGSQGSRVSGQSRTSGVSHDTRAAHGSPASHPSYSSRGSGLNSVCDF